MDGERLHVALGPLEPETGSVESFCHAVYELVTEIGDNMGTRNWCYALDEDSIRGLKNILITENRPSWARRLNGKTTSPG
jgi:hypothetical protein